MPYNYHLIMPFRTGRLRAQDVGKRNILEPVRFSDLVVILRNVPPALVLVEEMLTSEALTGICGLSLTRAGYKQ
jgi:hypothetical protein